MPEPVLTLRQFGMIPSEINMKFYILLQQAAKREVNTNTGEVAAKKHPVCTHVLRPDADIHHICRQSR